ncbi:MAG: ROK family protein [Bryobacteraceae bacterium]
MSKYSIGLDLGGTNLRAAAIDQYGTILGKLGGSTNLSEGQEAVLTDMAGAIRSLREDFGAGDLTGVGVGVPGFIIMKTGVITDSPNLPFFHNFPIRDELESRLATRVILENDANAAAMGEKWMGAGQNVDDLVLLTLGTGIGGGIISGGRVLHGFVGMAGEVGHITINPTGNPCGCGNRGCLEKHASATAVSAMARLMGLGENLTAAEVFSLAAGGDTKAQEIFVVMGESLGVALSILTNLFNFPLFLLSGGMLGAWDLFAPAMLGECRRRSPVFRATDTRIEKAALGNLAGLYGAACLPFLE